MPKFVLAFNNTNKGPSRLAATSVPNLKKRLQAYPDTDWTVKHYDVKFNLQSALQAIEDITLVDHNEVYNMVVSDKGRCRKIEEDPTAPKV